MPNGSAMAKTAQDSNFLGEFYNNSRLHHISQLGATFKQHINDLRSASNFTFPCRENLKRIGEKVCQLNKILAYSITRFSVICIIYNCNF